jgi:hypothetical protein
MGHGKLIMKCRQECRPLLLPCVELFLKMMVVKYLVIEKADGPVLPDGFIFRPKIAIWVNFGGSCNGRCWYILWKFCPF